MLTQLRYFQAIVDHGGMTAAAQALGVSQPALTRSLKALEYQLDTVLMDRRSGGFTLTASGELLLRGSRVLLAEQMSMIEDLKSLEKDERSVTYINGAPMTAVSFLSRILSRMGANYPECRVSVRGDNGVNYVWKQKAVADGLIDVALTLYDPMLRHEDLLQEILFEPELRILVSRSHPAVKMEGITLEEISSFRWILPPEGSSPRSIVESEFRLKGLKPPRNAIEISDWRIALDLIRTSDYVTAIPYHPACFEDQFRDFHILPLEFSVRPLAIAILTRAPSLAREGTRAVMETARALVSEATKISAATRT